MSAIPAFPGAEGGGATATGGRGGQVIHVTNLNAVGEGSLYAALKMPFPRTIVFDVSGIIDWSTVPDECGIHCVYISDGDLTIAGQTSPGYGIIIKNGQINLNANNIIIRYITIRPGKGDVYWGIGTIRGNRHIIDHVSVSWANDDMMGIWSYGGGTSKSTDYITLQWNLIGEGFVNPNDVWEGCGAPTYHCLWGAKKINVGASGTNSLESPYFYNVSIHHNLMAQGNERAPLIKNAQATVVNNIIYNSLSTMSMFRGGGSFDFIGNKYKNNIKVNANQREIGGMGKLGVPDMGIEGDPSIYVSRNMNVLGSIPVDQWSTMVSGHDYNTVAAPTGWQRFTQNPTEMYPITIHNATELDSVMLSTVGNSRYINDAGSWVNRNDVVDSNFIQDYLAGTGTTPMYQYQVKCTTGCTDYYPTYYSTTKFTDSDGDGISDTWETANGLNPNNAADGNYIAANGYTNLENFINGAGSDPVTSSSAPIITSFSNTKSNSNITSINLNTLESIIFNFTANQTVSGVWTKDGAGACTSATSCVLSWSNNGTKSVTAYGTNSNGSTSTITWTISILPTPTNAPKIGIGGATWSGHSTMNNLYPDNEYVKPGVYRDDFDDGTYDINVEYSPNLSLLNGKLKSYGTWAEVNKNIGNHTDIALFLKLTESNVSALQIFGTRSDTSRAETGMAYKTVLDANGFANISTKYTNGTLYTINSSTFVRTNNVESSYVFKTYGNNQKLYASATSSYESALANLIVSGTNSFYSSGNRMYMQLDVARTTESNLIDDIRVLKIDSSGNILHYGNLTANYEAPLNNVIESIIVNASLDADYTLEYRQYPSSSAWISLGTNLSGNQAKNTINGSKYQYTEIRITSYFNDTRSPEIRSIEFLTEGVEESNIYPRYDVNQNGVVDINDLTLVGQHLNEVVSIPYPRYDVNMDGFVNIGDITIVGQHFDEMY